MTQTEAESALHAVLQLPEPWAAALAAGRCNAPHAVLGAHGARVGTRDGVVVRVSHPEAIAAWVVPGSNGSAQASTAIALTKLDAPGCFGAFIAGARLPFDYRVRLGFAGDHVHEQGDAYRHWPTLGDHDLHLFNEGQHFELWRVLGAHPRVHEGDAGVAFAVWAPNAVRVSVIGDFCGWDGRVYPMRAMGASGVFELFIPGVTEGALYQFEILTRDGQLLCKADPFANQCEIPPGRACRVFDGQRYGWRDADWMFQRTTRDHRRSPMHVYELHLGSWRRHADGTPMSYRQVALPLVHHALHFGFTHVELLPVCEHPFEGSWGYQVTGFFAATSRFGSPDDFRYLVDVCHAHGIGVIMDWVPAHFPRDAFALARFDGTPLFEHADPLRAEHPDWGTYIFNYGRNEVRNFLVASALYWLKEMHVDGLRVDAVASMLYRDYSRTEGQWVPNEYGGREDLEAVAFVRGLNRAIQEHAAGCFTIAEESTSWQGVTASLDANGLGFTFKWNMGWMHDTLRYFARDPAHRKHHQDDLTFALLYEHSEHFVNALSHDEVVHGKRSLLSKMAGDPWQQLANLRALLAYQMLRPGKKLLFMGTESAAAIEWDHNQGLPAVSPEDVERAGFQRFVAELGALYRATPCLWKCAPEVDSFRWIDTSDHGQSVLSFTRASDECLLVVVLNLTPVPRHDYCIGVPRGGKYRTLLSSDDTRFGGSGSNVHMTLATDDTWMHGHPQRLSLALPPLSVLVMEAVRDGEGERLRDVAAQHGVYNDYYTMDGAHHVTDDVTRRALLCAMDVVVDAAPARALLAWPATRVVEQGSLALPLITLPAPRAGFTRLTGTLRVDTDDGQHWQAPLEYLAPAAGAFVRVEALSQLGLGHHQLTLELSWHDPDRTTEQRTLTQTLIVAAPQATSVHARSKRPQDGQARGVWSALYALRSERSWGMGDVADLRTLVLWAAKQGLDFVGINPLHASVLPCHPLSPYFPTTRLYRCELYLAIDAVPELATCDEAQRLIASTEVQTKLTALRAAERVDYRAVHAVKWPVLQALARQFIRQEAERDTERARAYRQYQDGHGESLLAYATFRVLAEVFSASSFHEWPPAYRDRTGAAVQQFATQHAEAIETHVYLQFELDRQLREVAVAARDAGMGVGLYLDLAVGTHHGSFDTWLHPALVATDVNLGAPPDALGPDGQDWGLCPLRPHAQQQDGYRFVRALLAHNMQHAGALRIDHAIGLTRQFWVPHEHDVAGTYVAFPLSEWLGVIAGESVRHRCMVIGEDLGTVPEGLRSALLRHGVYGCDVLHFVIDTDEPHNAHSEGRTQALASLNTHDLPPFVAFLRGDDIDLRERIGLIDAARAQHAHRVRRRRVARWITALRQEGLLAADAPDDDTDAVLAATHRRLIATGAAMVAISLDDLTGETVPLNVPGVTTAVDYEPWTRRMRMDLETVIAKVNT